MEETQRIVQTFAGLQKPDDTRSSLINGVATSANDLRHTLIGVSHESIERFRIYEKLPGRVKRDLHLFGMLVCKGNAATGTA